MLKKLLLINVIALLVIGKVIHYFFSQTEEDEKFFDKVIISGNIDRSENNRRQFITLNKELFADFDQIVSSNFFRFVSTNFDICTEELRTEICTCPLCSCTNLKHSELKSLNTLFPFNQSVPLGRIQNDPLHEDNFNFSDYSSEVAWHRDNNPTPVYYIGNITGADTQYYSSHIWRAIYQENCFSEDAFLSKKECRDNISFHKLLSGLHSTLTAFSSNKFFYYNQEKDISLYFSNATNFYLKLGNRTERIENLFFLNTLVLRNVFKLEKLLKEWNYKSGNNTDDALIHSKVNSFYSKHKENITSYLSNDHSYTLFKSSNLEDLLKRFEKIDSFVNCVDCEKTQLTLKLLVKGLIVLVNIESGKEVETLTKDELISLMHLYHKVSEGIKSFAEQAYALNLNLYMIKIRKMFILVFYGSIIVIANLYYLYKFWWKANPEDKSNSRKKAGTDTLNKMIESDTKHRFRTNPPDSLAGKHNHNKKYN